jgi:hypothetical protein
MRVIAVLLADDRRQDRGLPHRPVSADAFAAGQNRRLQFSMFNPTATSRSARHHSDGRDGVKTRLDSIRSVQTCDE